ncbi:MAG: 3-isopropylmalate dehydratase small subunit, partial [Thaumarchaeota archaeon]|nr:3-isopropylmalate dehydratase small subunit [Nitrososphaerota archaeon]
NAINVGLPILEAETGNRVEEGDELIVDAVNGVIENYTKGVRIEAKPLPPLALEIINAGGLVPYTRRKLGLE